MKKISNIGPGILITAAFIGPGTITICSIAGAKYEFVLLWALVVSILGTIVLQEMAARLGIISQRGLGEVVKIQISNKIWKWGAIILILGAIVFGNAAYEAGNISGAVLGLTGLFGNDLKNMWTVLLGISAGVLLLTGSYKILEKVLIGLVVLMSISFILTAVITTPNLLSIIKGMFIPRIPEGSLWVIIGLVGTTIVPYNLFLHASLVSEKWNSSDDLHKSNNDIWISILLGGLVSMCILICAAAVKGTTIDSISDLSKGIRPLYGSFASIFLAIGFFASGVTSAITAPLAAAYVAQNFFGWRGGMKSYKFKLVWALILGVGVLFSSFEFKPVRVIAFAQVANGLLLPIIAIFLLWVVNLRAVLGKYTNTKWQNVFGIIVILGSIILGISIIYKKITGV